MGPTTSSTRTPPLTSGPDSRPTIGPRPSPRGQRRQPRRPTSGRRPPTVGHTDVGRPNSLPFRSCRTSTRGTPGGPGSFTTTDEPRTSHRTTTRPSPGRFDITGVPFHGRVGGTKDRPYRPKQCPTTKTWTELTTRRGVPRTTVVRRHLYGPSPSGILTDELFLFFWLHLSLSVDRRT